MKFLFLVLLSLTVVFSFAQNAKNLQYAEIDSLLSLYEESEQYDKGIKLSIEASQKSGKQDSLCGEYLEWVGYFYELSSQNEKAIEYYNKTLDVFNKALGKNTTRSATTLSIWGLCLENMGNYAQALPLYIQAKDIREKALSKEHPDFALSLNNLAGLHQNMGNYAQALSLYIQAKDISEKVFGKEHPDFALSLNNLASIYLNMGNYDQALQFFIQTKDIFEKALGKEHPDFGVSLNNLAGLHQRMGNYDQALPLYIQAKDISEKILGKEHPDFALSLNNLAELYQEMGNYDQALPLVIQAKDIREKALGKEHPDFAVSLSNLAELYKNMGNYTQGLALLIQAKDIREKVLGIEHPDFALSLNNLAIFHQSMGNYDQALSICIQAKDIREKALGKEHPDFALSLNNLALLYYNMGNYEQALPLHIQAKDIREKALGKEHPDFASSLNNLALLYYNMGNYTQALPLYIQAKDIREKILGKEHPDFANLLNNLANLYKSMGNYVQAWISYQESMNSSSGLLLKHDFNQSWLDTLKNASFASNKHLENMVRSLMYVYDLLELDSLVENAIDKQIMVCNLATTLLSKQRNLVTNEKDKLRILTLSNDWLQNSLKILTPQKDNHQAFALSDENKSVLLLQATKSEEAYRMGELPDSLVLKDKKLLKKQSELEAKLLEKRSKEEKKQLLDELNHVNQELSDFIAMIKKKYPKYHQLKYAQVDAKVEEIQALLDDKTALLEYVIGDSVVHIFFVDKKQVFWEKSYVRNQELEDNIKTLHESLSNYKLIIEDKESSYKSYTENASWLYQKLLVPVLKDKQNIQNLIIVTDGELGHLPFETFLIEPAPQVVTDYHQLHYLVNDYNISYNYSATLWRENKRILTPKNNPNTSVRKSGQILAMAANYNIKLDSSMMDVRLPTDQWLRDILKPLPAARKEVETLQGKYQGFFAFDAEASEKTVKAKASEYAILHFATHGILDAKRPILSSLAFTEDNDSTESNFWQAHEISKMELNADLVVLSACETGYGKFEAGNGIASLARAFMYAGASSLIVSLWQVNDFATSEIMKNLYANLADGMKKDEALRQAKLQYMKEAKGIMAHPAFWSPFIMMGKTDAIYLKTKGGYFGWFVGGGILALGGGVFAMRNRRKE